MMTGTVNEHRPARGQGEEGGEGSGGGGGAIIVTHAAKIKATTQRGLTLSFTMRHFSGSRRQTVDTELVSQGSHIFCRKQYLAGRSAPPGSTENRSGGRGKEWGGIKVNKNYRNLAGNPRETLNHKWITPAEFQSARSAL